MITKTPVHQMYSMMRSRLVILVSLFFILLTTSCQESETKESITISAAPLPFAGMMTEEIDMAAGSAMQSGTETPPTSLIDFTLLALDPLSNRGVLGLTAELKQPIEYAEMSSTNEEGNVTFSLPAESDYEVVLSGETYPPHHVLGELGTEASQQITFVSTLSLSQQVTGALGLSPDDTTGIVVVGLDAPNLSPAVGASATLSSPFMEAFTLGRFGPVKGDTITQGSGGFVSFAQVTAGPTDVQVTPPEGQVCAVFPAERSMTATIEVYPGEVTIIAFTCRPISE